VTGGRFWPVRGRGRREPAGGRRVFADPLEPGALALSEERRRGSDRRNLLASSAVLLGEFIVDVLANSVHLPAGIGSWVRHHYDWGLPIAVIALICWMIFAFRLFATERADEDNPLQPGNAFPPLPQLVGRDDAVREVTARARRGGVVFVHGPAGIGVSAVALRAGLELSPGPAKQRYVDLRGQNPRHPESARRAVIRVLSVIGVRPGSAQDPHRAMARLVETLRDTGIVLILDNAERTEQIAWLARGVRGAYVIAAGDLPPRELPPHLPHVRVPPLQPDAALDLLARQGETGGGVPRRRFEYLLRRLRHHAAVNSVAVRVGADRAAAAELARGYLGFPRVAIEMGRWLAANPRVTLGAVLQDLRRDTDSELAFIVRRQLDGTSVGARRLLSLLARAPVAELPLGAVAAMADASLDRTADHLAELTSRSLVEWSRPSRCRITTQARRLAELPRPRTAARALARLAAHLAGLAVAHAEALEPGQPQVARGQAEEWLRAADVTLLHLISAPDPPPRAAAYLWQIAGALDTWFAREHRQEDRRAAAQAMADAAARLGDDTAAAIAELRLAAIARERGDLTAALRGLERVHQLLAAGGPWRNQFHTESAVYYITTGDLDAARDHLLACYQGRPRRDAAGRISDLINRATLEIRADQLGAAHDTLTEALDLAEDSSDLDAQAHAHELLGILDWRTGHPNRADGTWEQARDLYQQAGNDTGQARCLQHQGTALIAQPDGDPRKAARLLSASLDLRADQQSGVGVALAHLYLAHQSATTGPNADLAGHRQAGLAALRAWVREASEPAEVTLARKRLTELSTGR
jgi:tetratricopeptide (TPR) repeat protein